MYKEGSLLSTITPKLGLIKPAISDEIHQTIQDLSNNFQILDDVAEVYVSTPPTSGAWKIGDRVWNASPDIGEPVGWVNIREGMSAPVWSPVKRYNVNDLVIPNPNNGHVYKCVQAGYSGVNQPTFPVSSGSTVKDTHGATTWQASKQYNLNDIVVPTIDINRFYVCTVAGVSGSTEPNWSLIDGGTVDDGMVIWTGYRIVTWEEAGVSAEFRPFGRIE